ncbi:MerR family transcriptional regulator [Streptomyces parvulus]|uniref:helix-turn-helix domain-containing protein n=1 Tax=Streptomyces parvulus TaxID=146923 RepID=UPI003421012A
MAELAGTTTKAIRHYHEIGLLDEPERSCNGYKRYRVGHLVRLLRIRRLTDLGVPLSDIPAVESGDGRSRKILRTLDAGLATEIERLQGMRRDLAAVMENRVPIDMPSGFQDLPNDLPEARRSLLLAYSSILTPAAMAELRSQLAAPQGTLDAEFESLDEDASEEVRQHLAERLAPEARRQQQDHPRLADVQACSRLGRPLTESVVTQALTEFYNGAHLDVLRRVHGIVSGEAAREAGQIEPS